MILVTHPTGNANVRGILSAFDRAGKLGHFITTFAAHKTSSYLDILPKSLKREILRRTYDLDLEQISTYPWRELLRLAAAKLNITALTQHETGLACIDRVYQELDHYAANWLKNHSNEQGISAVYGYEDGVRATFSQAQAMGIPCFYDLPIGYWRVGQALLQEEAELQPAWATTITAILDSKEKLLRKDQELLLADKIFVASSFTRQTLRQAPELQAPIYVVPYGAPSVVITPQLVRKHSTSKLRVLFVGLLSQRKGLSYLLEAVKLLGNQVELTLIGKCVSLPQPLVTALNTHHYIESLPHAHLLEQMQAYDVLVFPSLFEGFGLVILEAMSRGLPVITTPHTAGADVITDGKNGFIVPIRCAESIAEKLQLLIADPDLLAAMRIAAQDTALYFSWSRYYQQMITLTQSPHTVTQSRG